MIAVTFPESVTKDCFLTTDFRWCYLGGASQETSDDDGQDALLVPMAVGRVRNTLPAAPGKRTPWGPDGGRFGASERRERERSGSARKAKSLKNAER